MWRKVAVHQLRSVLIETVDRNGCREVKGVKEDISTLATSVKTSMLKYGQLVVVCYGVRRLAIGVEKSILRLTSCMSRCGSWPQEAER